MIKIGDQIITSKGRYGRVIKIDNTKEESKCLIRIGLKDYWILESQLTLASHTVKLKVTYEFNYCNKFISDSIEVPLKRDTILFQNNSNNLVDICKNTIELQLNTKVKIIEIKIS